MEIMLYSEINILSVVIMFIIAVESLVIKFDISLKIKLFAASVFLAVAANVLDFLWNISTANYWSIPVPAMWAIDFMYFISFGLSSYFWFLYTETVHRDDYLKKRTYILCAIPLVVLAGLLIVSFFNGCVFYFDENRVYHRGSLFYAQHILSYGYIFVSSVLCIVRAFNKKYFDRKEEFIALASFVIPPVICAVVQAMLQSIPILSVGIMVSYILVFINSLENLISTDTLTEIATRRELLHQLTNGIKSLKADSSLYFLFIDIDNFKHINDTYGHPEGDRALKALAVVLKQVCTETDGFCARYGGDEFAVVIRLEKSRDISEIFKRIYELVEQKGREEGFGFDLSVSIGCSQYESNMVGIQELISRADASMYDRKMHKKNGIKS